MDFFPTTPKTPGTPRHLVVPIKRASSFKLELPGDDLVNGRIRLNIHVAMVKERFRWLTSSKYFTK